MNSAEFREFNELYLQYWHGKIKFSMDILEQMQTMCSRAKEDNTYLQYSQERVQRAEAVDIYDLYLNVLYVLMETIIRRY